MKTDQAGLYNDASLDHLNPTASRSRRILKQPFSRFQDLCAVTVMVLLALAANSCSPAPIRQEATPEPSRSKLNVVLVTVDSLRADHLGYAGSKSSHTPNFDALARRGAVFTEALAPVPEATPSIASLMTGQYPATHGVRVAADDSLSADAVTLAERFKELGYRTGACAGSVLLHPKFGLAQGFDTYQASFAEVSMPSRLAETGVSAEKVADRALEFLESAREGPFFLWVNFQDPHYFYFPPEPFAKQFAASPYDGEIAYVDREAGRVLDKIHDYGLDGRTIVILAGSNGEGLGDAGEAYHGATLQRATTVVPLVIVSPVQPAAGSGALAPGTQVTAPVSLVDVAPTLLALVGSPAPPGMEGVSLASAPDAARPLYLESLMPEQLFGWAPLYGVVAGRWKYVEGESAHPGGGGALYDRLADPGGKSDVSGQHPVERDQLAGLARAYAQKSQASGSEAMSTLPAALAARVRALGYAVEPASRRPARSLTGPDRTAVANDALKADRSAHRRQLEAAAFLFDSVLKKDPDNYIALLDSALLLISQRDNPGAMKRLTRTRDLYPARGEPYHQIGHLLVSMQGKSAAARADELFSIAAALDPLNEEVLYDTACAHSRKGDKTAALDLLEKAVKAGFLEYGWMAVDTDMDPVRGEARFDAITGGRAKKKPEAK